MENKPTLPPTLTAPPPAAQPTVPDAAEVAAEATSLPFDLTKLDNNDHFRKQRRVALKRTAWSSLAVLLIAWWFIQPTLLTSHAIGNYKHQHYTPARDWLTPLTWTSPQQFVIAFNSGTVDTQLKHFDTAQKELFRALALAPAAKRCMVLQNLVYSLQAHAKSLVSQHQSGDATVYTKQASTYMQNNPKCFGASQAAGGGGGGGGGSSAAQQAQSDTPAPSSDQQQQLQQREQQGEQQQQQYINQDTFDPSDPHLKQW